MNAPRFKVPARVELARTILGAPRVRIEMTGDDHARRIHRAFTARHPRLRLTSAKRWGVALLPLPATFDDYLAGGSRKVLRQKRRLAVGHGFRYAEVDSVERLDQVMDIHRSSPVRQGRSLPGYYLDRDEVAATLAQRPSLHGILDADDRLRAYAWAPLTGEAVVFETLLGHAADLELGTMYLLMSEVIRVAIEHRDATGAPTWAMYDTFWGASQGLAYFKSRLGFRPYTVDWVWTEPEAASAPGQTVG